MIACIGDILDYVYAPVFPFVSLFFQIFIIVSPIQDNFLRSQSSKTTLNKFRWRKPFINILNSFTIYINNYTVQEMLEDTKWVMRSH